MDFLLSGTGYELNNGCQNAVGCGMQSEVYMLK